MNSNGFGSTSPKRASMLRVCYDQLRLLIWKSYKLQTRSISMTLLEIMVPVSAFLLFKLLFSVFNK
jgi:hypothetical protein